MKKISSKTPESTLALITSITEQLNELLTQADILVIDAITHILAAHAASNAVPYDQPMWMAKAFRHIRLNSKLSKITVAKITNNLSLMENNTAHLAARITWYEQKDYLPNSQTNKAGRLLSEEINKLSSASLNGQKQLKRLASTIRDKELSVEKILIPEETKLYFKGIEASTRRLVLISRFIASNTDFVLSQLVKKPVSLKEEDVLPVDNKGLFFLKGRT